MNNLPDEVNVMICSFCDIKTRLMLRNVSARWRKVIKITPIIFTNTEIGVNRFSVVPQFKAMKNRIYAQLLTFVSKEEFINVSVKVSWGDDVIVKTKVPFFGTLEGPGSYFRSHPMCIIWRGEAATHCVMKTAVLSTDGVSNNERAVKIVSMFDFYNSLKKFKKKYCTCGYFNSERIVCVDMRKLVFTSDEDIAAAIVRMSSLRETTFPDVYSS